MAILAAERERRATAKHGGRRNQGCRQASATSAPIAETKSRMAAISPRSATSPFIFQLPATRGLRGDGMVSIHSQHDASVSIAGARRIEAGPRGMSNA